MTIKELFNTTKENYEIAIRTGNECSIANVINAYNTFCTLYRMWLISAKTFHKYFNDFYNMADEIYSMYIYNDLDNYDEIKRWFTISFTKFDNIFKGWNNDD